MLKKKKKKKGRTHVHSIGWKETYIIYIMIHYYDDGNGKKTKKKICFVLLVWCVPQTSKRFSKIYNNIFFVIMI